MSSEPASAQFTPPPMVHAITGHLFTGAIKGVIVIVVLWAAGAVGLVPRSSMDSIIGFVAMMVLVGETARRVVGGWPDGLRG